MRILWHSDKVFGGYSAYSKVTREVCTRLVGMGHAVAHVPMGRANNMGVFEWQGIRIYPSGDDPFAERAAEWAYADFGADVLVTLKDVWLFSRLPNLALNWCPYVVIDHEDVSAQITSNLRYAFKVLAATRFAQRELRNAGIESAYVPHGCDVGVFSPLDRLKCKRLWHLPEDDFTVLFVGRNQSRKLIPHQLRIYRRFLDSNPDIKSHLMLWTSVLASQPPEDPVLAAASAGVNLLPEVARLGLGDRVMFPDEEDYARGLPDGGADAYSMQTLYNSADVLLNCTGGEGFGLTLVEAQSTGLAVVATDYAGGAENVGVGYTVPWRDYVILNTPGTRYAVADIDRAAEALSKIANADREKLARKARAFALRYSWDSVMVQHWRPLLLEMCDELFPLVTREGVGRWRSS